MSAYSIWQAVSQRWQASWVYNGSPRTVILGENQMPPTDRASARLTVVDGGAVAATLKFSQVGGAKSFDRHAGVIIIQIFTPVGQDQGQARGLGDMAAAIFRKVTFSGVHCLVPYHQPLGVVEHWNQHNVNCPYRYHEIT